jgi:CTP:molybdopterin cytidylyltransferase MocA
MVDALVLAGRPNRGKLSTMSPEPNEAMIPIGGRAMISYVVEALVGSRGIDRTVVLGPESLLAPALGGLARRVGFVEPVGDLVENLLAGLQALDGAAMVLVSSSDVPLLTPAVVDGFLEECARRQADLHYPILSRELAERCFPGMRRTYAALRDGTFTGGNLVLLNPETVRARAAEARAFFAARKNPLRLAAVLGPTFVVRLLLRRLTVDELESFACRVFGLRGAHAVRTAYPEIGVDVDKPADYQLVSGLLAARTAG